jgi:hypothetical protein
MIQAWERIYLNYPSRSDNTYIPGNGQGILISVIFFKKKSGQVQKSITRFPPGGCDP